jgi:hypothetical protein
MKNLKLAIFVVGTTVMLWLGCSNRTYDNSAQAQGYSVVDRGEDEMTVEDSLISDGAGTMDEFDEVK